MKLKKSLVVLFLLGWILGSAALALAQTPNLRIGFNGFGGTGALYLGQDAGIFRKHNLGLEMIFIPGGSLSLQALIGKISELLMTGGPPVINAVQQGAC